MIRADLIVMRHALALSATEASVEFDAQRPLADGGRHSAAKLGRALLGLGLAPKACHCSPLVRARETAECVLQAASGDLEPELSTALAPGCGIDDLLQTVNIVEGGPMLVVIHEPDVSRMLAMVLGHPWPCAVLPGDCFAFRIIDGRAELVLSLSPERGH